MTTCQAVQHAGEISLGIETVQLCGLDDRVDDCRAVTAAIRADEQKILARDGYFSQQSPRQIPPLLPRNGLGALNARWNMQTPASSMAPRATYDRW